MSNNTNVDSFYELFKYPESNKGAEIKFYLLRGKKEKGLTRFAKIKVLAIGIKKEIKTWLSEDK